MRTLKNIGTDTNGGLEGMVRQPHGNKGQRGGIVADLLLPLAGGFLIGAIINICGATRNDFPEYHYTGRLNSQNVSFYEQAFTGKSFLTLQRPDGTTVKYVLTEEPEHKLVLKEVVVSAGGQKVAYSADSPNHDVAKVVEAARQDVNSHLGKIVAEKTRLYSAAAVPSE